ncbi:MAG: L,D-transpeptidase family protein [Chthoniobacteraceae bacterium]|nr:L,D-transpeptidase family protein [Chthoniobacteraceae bacterium]
MRFPIPRNFAILVVGAVLVCSGSAFSAPFFGLFGVKKANESLHRQDPPKVSARLLDQVTQANSRVLVSLGKQRAYLLLNNEIAIDTPISSGKAAGMTPTGTFRVQEKDPDHRSNLYGNFVDSQGRVVRAGVSARIDSAPSGTHFQGSPMYYFMRIADGVGMHVGILPGYPASHGCIRMPAEIAPMFYQRVRVGTPVEVVH